LPIEEGTGNRPKIPVAGGAIISYGGKGTRARVVTNPAYSKFSDKGKETIACNGRKIYTSEWVIWWGEITLERRRP